MKSSPLRRALLAALLVVGLLLLVPIMLDAFARQMLYPAPPIRVPSPSAPLEELAIETSEGHTVVGWLRERPEGPAVLFLHGNGENLETLRYSGLFEELHRLGASVLAIDYPGYGRSSGRAGEAALVASGLAGFEALAGRFPGRELYIVGWSLGAAVAIQAALPNEDRLAGLVLLSPWHDLQSLASRFFPGMLVRVALRDRYHSAEAADALREPVLVVHGERDSIIPVDHGRRLADRLPEGSRFVALPNAGHNDLMARDETWSLLAEALGLLGPGG
ncbi:MAG: lysophospholipase [Holophagales bacterium]|nr:lysophospholipase [Holophagales bacterium]